MSDLRPSGSLGKRGLLRKLEPVFLIIPSALIGILLVELFCRLFVPSVGPAQDAFDGTRRLFFLDGAGTIFQDHGDIFTFFPHDDVRTVSVYFSDDGYQVVYDYRFRTNNFGLVQDANVVPGRDSSPDRRRLLHRRTRRRTVVPARKPANQPARLSTGQWRITGGRIRTVAQAHSLLDGQRRPHSKAGRRLHFRRLSSSGV